MQRLNWHACCPQVDELRDVKELTAAAVAGLEQTLARIDKAAGQAARSSSAGRKGGALAAAGSRCTHCVHTYKITNMHAYTHIHTYIRACIHTYIHTYIHTCIHSYMYVYIHTPRHTY